MRNRAVDPDCAFCQIVNSDAEPDSREPAAEHTAEIACEIVWRSDEVVAFLDRSPLFYGHTLVVPASHVPTLADLDEEILTPLFGFVRRLSAVMPAALGVQGTFVANNNIVSQSVPHLHVHVVPRVRGDGLRGFFWPRQRPDAARSAAAAAALRQALAQETSH